MAVEVAAGKGVGAAQRGGEDSDRVIAPARHRAEFSSSLFLPFSDPLGRASCK